MMQNELDIVRDVSARLDAGGFAYMLTGSMAIVVSFVGDLQTMTDTSPEIEEMVRVRLMALPGAVRFRMGAEMFEAARRMILASLPPGLSETERKRLLYERIYGEPLPRRD